MVLPPAVDRNCGCNKVSVRQAARPRTLLLVLLWCMRPQALVDAPAEGRRVMNFKRLALTDIKVEIPRLASKKVLTEAFNAAGAAPWMHAGGQGILLWSYRIVACSHGTLESPAQVERGGVAVWTSWPAAAACCA